VGSRSIRHAPLGSSSRSDPARSALPAGGVGGIGAVEDDAVIPPVGTDRVPQVPGPSGAVLPAKPRCQNVPVPAGCRHMPSPMFSRHVPARRARVPGQSRRPRTTAHRTCNTVSPSGTGRPVMAVYAYVTCPPSASPRTAGGCGRACAGQLGYRGTEGGGGGFEHRAVSGTHHSNNPSSQQRHGFNRPTSGTAAAPPPSTSTLSPTPTYNSLPGHKPLKGTLPAH
jgi:hypothetical protein